MTPAGPSEAFLQPASWAEALEARAAWPECTVVAGGTDVMVDINFGRLRPTGVLDLSRVAELRGGERRGDRVRIGAGTTYHHLLHELADELPGLAQAARTVGSPPIRNRGTIGGNLGSASPAGDCHPPLLAVAAEVELCSIRGARRVPLPQFFVGPKHSVLGADELIGGVWAKVASGPQVFCKAGVRNAMVIAACSFALALDPEQRRVGTGIGSAGPVPLAAAAAEQFLQGHLEETGGWETPSALPEAAVARFAELVSGSSRPIDDVRATAAYRRHALSVMARRALAWCWDEYRSPAP